MTLFARPWVRLATAAVLTLVAIFVMSAIAIVRAEPSIALPYSDGLGGEPRRLPIWDNDVSRTRYTDEGYEILVKAPGRSAAVEIDTWPEWDLRIEVSIVFRDVRADWREDERAPTAGITCDDSTTGNRSGAHYDFRVGPDGRFAIYRWTLIGPGAQPRLLASNLTAGVPRVGVNTPVRVLVECQRRKPTTLRLSIDGRQVASVQDEDARFWGRAGLVVGAGDEQNVAVAFRDLVITGR